MNISKSIYALSIPSHPSLPIPSYLISSLPFPSLSIYLSFPRFPASTPRDHKKGMGTGLSHKERTKPDYSIQACDEGIWRWYMTDGKVDYRQIRQLTEFKSGRRYSTTCLLGIHRATYSAQVTASVHLPQARKRERKKESINHIYHQTPFYPPTHSLPVSSSNR